MQAHMDIACCRFDFAGNGESGGAFKFANYSEEVRQAVRALPEAKQHQDIFQSHMCHDFEVQSEYLCTRSVCNVQVDQMEAAISYLQSRGKRVTGLLGHSKGGTEVILYAARHDDDKSGIRIVNVCGRCHLKRGIDRRFDAATLARLEQEGSLQLPHPKTGQPFTLTSQVRAY